jgi:hypothetical protein
MNQDEKELLKMRLHVFLILLWAAISISFMFKYIYNGICHNPGYDFSLRYHEVECLRQGIDPYDVVTQRVQSKEFALFATPEVALGAKALHVYTPWEYTWFLPLSFLSEKAAGGVFLFLSILALISIAIYAYYSGHDLRGRWEDGLFVATSSLLLGSAAGELFEFANYGAFNAFLILLLAVALSKGYNILAGIVWALLMTKPQIGVLFAIPLLFKRRYITMGVAVAICVVSILPPMLMCGRNPLDLLLEVPRGCAFVAEENGTMLIPSQIFVRLKGRVPSALLGGVSMIVGSGICVWLTWRLRKNNSWLVIITPAVVCALLWNYCKPHDRVILWVTQFLIAHFMLRTKKTSIRIFCLMILVLTAWPFVYDTSYLTKGMRRVSLALLVYGCWMLPKLNLFETQNEK